MSDCRIEEAGLNYWRVRQRLVEPFVCFGCGMCARQPPRPFFQHRDRDESACKLAEFLRLEIQFVPIILDLDLYSDSWEAQ